VSGAAARLRALVRGRRFLFRSPEEVFTSIWRSGFWTRAIPGGSRSGPGSSPEVARPVALALPPFLARLGARSLLDVPCGDFGWMSGVDRSGFDYVGADIVAPLVAELSARHGDARTRFVALDLARDPLPRADAVLCRDALVHLSFRLGLASLARIRESGATWLLATTFPGLPRNEDVVTGLWRPLDLEKEPFSLPRPVETICENADPAGLLPDKHLALWRAADLPAARGGRA
jgi:hypothetical protein